MKELQITRYLRSSKIIASLLLLTGIILIRTPLYLFIFGHEAYAFILVPGFLVLQHLNICVDRGKVRTFFAVL